MIGTPYGIGPGKSLVRVAHGVSLIHSPCGQRQSERQDHGDECPQSVPDLNSVTGNQISPFLDGKFILSPMTLWLLSFAWIFIFIFSTKMIPWANPLCYIPFFFRFPSGMKFFRNRCSFNPISSSVFPIRLLPAVLPFLGSGFGSCFRIIFFRGPLSKRHPGGD